MQWKNELTDLLHIDYPIIQAPMLGVTTVEMVAAISNLGGLGSLPVGGLSPETTLELILKTKELTNRPFAVNLFAHHIPEWDWEQVREMQKYVETISAKYNFNSPGQAPETVRFYSYREQVEILLSENIPVVSFTFGVFSDEIIKAFQQKGTVLIGTATCVKEAKILDEKNIDIIIAQGIEAGGHRGTFLDNEPLPQVGSMSLIPQFVTAIKKPVIAAGGINNGRTIKAALALGASGVQVGTAFIASDESAAVPSYKKAVQEASDTDSVLTRAFTGRWARGIRNTFIEEFENTTVAIPAYPMQIILTSALRNAAQQQDNKEFNSLWAGQSSSKAEAKSSAEIFKELLRSAEGVE